MCGSAKLYSTQRQMFSLNAGNSLQRCGRGFGWQKIIHTAEIIASRSRRYRYSSCFTFPYVASGPSFAMAATQTTTSSRLTSLDQFRGYTMLGMLLVNFLGSYAICPRILRHTHDYCSYADTIMPQFLFAAGFAMRLSLGRRIEKDGRMPRRRPIQEFCEPPCPTAFDHPSQCVCPDLTASRTRLRTGTAA